MARFWPDVDVPLSLFQLTSPMIGSDASQRRD
jgi:hypothetical protein